jgi:hypothetical protein
MVRSKDCLGENRRVHLTVLWISDTPFSLVAAVLEAIPILAATNDTGFAWTLYTGDLVSHDPENELSRWVVLL